MWGLVLIMIELLYILTRGIFEGHGKRSRDYEKRKQAIAKGEKAYWSEVSSGWKSTETNKDCEIGREAILSKSVMQRRRDRAKQWALDNGYRFIKYDIGDVVDLKTGHRVELVAEWKMTRKGYYGYEAELYDMETGDLMGYGAVGDFKCVSQQGIEKNYMPVGNFPVRSYREGKIK